MIIINRKIILINIIFIRKENERINIYINNNKVNKVNNNNKRFIIIIKNFIYNKYAVLYRDYI